MAKKTTKQIKKAAPKKAKAAPKKTAPQKTEVAVKKPMTQAEIEVLEQNLEDKGYRVSIMTNVSDADRKKAFEAALEKAKKNKKEFEEIWEGNMVTLWVKSEK